MNALGVTVAILAMVWGVLLVAAGLRGVWGEWTGRNKHRQRMRDWADNTKGHR